MLFRVEGRILKGFVEMADAYAVDELCVDVDAENGKLVLGSLDPAHVVAMQWVHKEKYVPDSEEEGGNRSFALDIATDLYHAAKNINKGDIVELEIRESDVELRVYSNRTNTVIKRFVMPQLTANEDNKVRNLPEPPEDTIIRVDRKMLLEAVKMVGTRFEVCVLDYSDGVLSVYNYQSSDGIVRRTDIQQYAEPGAAAHSKAMYGTTYLLNMLSKIDVKNVVLAFATDYPLKVEYSDKNDNITVFLAPRVE